MISVSPNGRQVTVVSGIAPGPCDDRDFGEMLPGRDGASGAEFNSFRLSATIRADGAFAKKNLRSSRGPRHPKLSGTFSISGTFSGDVVRGQVEATATTSYDTCTANVRFTARRVRP